MAAPPPLILITGAGGAVGSALVDALRGSFRVVALDRPGGSPPPCELIEVDLTSDDSVRAAFAQFRERFGKRIASVIHLAAYFDFTGEPHPLYESLNVEGTRRLLRALRTLEVEQFIYPGTMLVRSPARPGEYIDETAPIAPKWAYPQSKAAAVEVIRAEHGNIPYVVLELAGLYDEATVVPTLANQIARIYERDLQSRLFAGDAAVGQAFLHKDDMADAFVRAIEQRHSLPPQTTLLIGEREAPAYETLQDTIGKLVHGQENWATLSLPKWAAKAGAAAQVVAEPIVPDAIDQGEKPFVRPFMIDLAEDHYALDTRRAREMLGWRPRHRLLDTLPRIIEALKRDPLQWYRNNGVTPPQWMESASNERLHPERLRARYEAQFRRRYDEFRWAHFVNVALGAWLVASPPLLGYGGTALAVSDIASGAMLLVLGCLTLSWRFGWARTVIAVLAVWIMFAPLVFWTDNAAAYLNGTFIGMLAMTCAAASRPAPGVNPLAATTGPIVPPGWEYSPSGWAQRLPIILLAWVGFHISRYLTAYQLGHIEGVWDPFFAGGPGPQNGTEEIITSDVSRAWPVPDAGVGALTYALEIITGAIGSSRRWRTMPWLVILFGIMIVPLGAVSITFIIIQPIIIGTWCTLCLVAAAAMLLQIPYSLDEIIATLQFLGRRKRAGQSVLRVFFVGDTDEEHAQHDEDSFERKPSVIAKDMLGGGVSVPWNLLLCMVIGIWLMFTRLTVQSPEALANMEHLIGALVVTASVTALAEVARSVRFLNALLGLALLVVAALYDGPTVARIADVACGLALILLSIRRGPIRHTYGRWNACIK